MPLNLLFGELFPIRASVGNQQLHQEHLQQLRDRMMCLSKQGKTVQIYHGSTNSTRVQKYRKDQTIDLSNLNRILKIDINNRFAIVEPNISMDALVDECFKQGLIPPVVMEFPGITVGGGIQGGAGESSSFHWGLFNNCFLEYEVLLGSGEIIIASPRKNRRLFAGIACSYGSLGIITSAKLKLIPAKKFVKLFYYRTRDFEEAITRIKKLVTESVDYIDGILFSKKLGVIMAGKLVDSGKYPVTTFSRAIDDWFYLHAKNIVQKNPQWEELVPIKDYLFRYDRGAFWMGQEGFQLFHVPFNRVTRFLLNPFFKTRVMYRFLHALHLSQKFLIQDLCLPEDKVTDFLELIEKITTIFPVWLCPLQPAAKEFLAPTNLKTSLVINVGVWGKSNAGFSGFIELNRWLEETVQELGGRKVLYAHCYYPRDQFWKIYDRKRYEDLRRKFKAEKVFADIYEKTHVSEKYQTSLTQALAEIIRSLFKLPVS